MYKFFCQFSIFSFDFLIFRVFFSKCTIFSLFSSIFIFLLSIFFRIVDSFPVWFRFFEKVFRFSFRCVVFFQFINFRFFLIVQEIFFAVVLLVFFIGLFSISFRQLATMRFFITTSHFQPCLLYTFPQMMLRFFGKSSIPSNQRMKCCLYWLEIFILSKTKLEKNLSDERLGMVFGLFFGEV